VAPRRRDLPMDAGVPDEAGDADSDRQSVLRHLAGTDNGKCHTASERTRAA
jgi:hypothetical protein